MHRRDFGKLLAFGTAAAALPAPALALHDPRPMRPKQIVKPKVLRPGDTVGVTSPATQAFDYDRIRVTQEQIEALGFRPKLGAHVADKHGYFAGTDENRAADINAMFADDEVDAIFFFSGGWGSPRLLPHLDYDLIRRNPKIILGYSDITALLNGIHQRTGIVTFHGPNGSSRLPKYTLEHLKRTLMSTEPIGILANPPKPEDELVRRDYRIITIRPGVASGPLVGGNLSLVAALMGTPWEVDTRGAILLLEDVNEELYRVDRMLSTLRLGGKLADAAAIVFGTCSRCPVEGPSFSLEEIMRDHFEDLGVPVMAGYAFGHISEQLTLPIGMPGTVDTTAGTITIDEPAVRPSGE
ncbi:MAG: LD-carboxypeptidase [Acidobacteria bacterium]|nr:LD-carboxypeptidase [Acidobacteriota bacterium]